MNSKLVDISKLSMKITPQGLHNPFETRDPDNFLNEVTNVVVNNISDKKEQVQTFDHLLELNPSTKEMGTSRREFSLRLFFWSTICNLSHDKIQIVSQDIENLCRLNMRMWC